MAPRKELDRQVLVASVDTLKARMLRKESVQLPQIGLLVVDECHIGVTVSFGRLLEIIARDCRPYRNADPGRRPGAGRLL